MSDITKYIKVLAAGLLVACLAIGGCKSKTDDGRIPPKVMKKLLLDVNMAETLSTYQKDSTYKHGGSKNMDSLAVYYRNIFAHYNITQKQFEDNLEWYKDHPDEMDTIYTDIITVATGIQAAVSPLPAGPPPVPAPPIATPPVKK